MRFLGLLAILCCVLLTWVVLAVIMTGIGAGLRRLAIRKPPKAHDFVLLPWLGLSLTVMVLQIWHLFLPVNGWAFALFVALGAAGWMLNGAAGLAQALRYVGRHKGQLLAAVLALLWLADRSIGPINQYDSGLYHLAGVRWDNKFAIIPGLVNLHGRLAFNNSILLLNAMVELGPWYGRSGHLINGFLAALTVPIVIGGMGCILRCRGRRLAMGLVAALVGVGVMLYAVAPEISSPATDVAPAILLQIAGWRLLALLLRVRKGDQRNLDILFVTLVLATAVTAKLSAIFFATLAWPLAMAVWWWQSRRAEARAETRRTAVVCIAGSVLLIGVWCLRGYILSGYPFYPSSFGRLPFSWTASEHHLVEERYQITVQAKSIYSNRSIGTTQWAWVMPWLKQWFFTRGVLSLALPAFLGSFAAIAYAIGRAPTPIYQRYHRALRLVWLILIPLLIALAIWFVVAPLYRFGGALWWTFASAMLAMAALGVARRWLLRHRGIALSAVILLAILPIVQLMVLIRFRYRNNPDMIYYHLSPLVALFHGPGPDHGLWPAPKPDVVPITTRWGLRVFVPEKGDTCWDGPLPCTFRVDPNLRLRVPGDLSSGFVIQRQDQTKS